MVYPSLETQGQLVGERKSLNGRGKNSGWNFSSPEFFPHLFRLFPVPTNCPWVSEDVVYQLFLHQQKPCSRNNLSPHSKWSVTWSTILIQYGRKGLYNFITMRTPICTQTGASSWLLKRHLSFSCGNPARPQPGENTVIIFTSSFSFPPTLKTYRYRYI